MIQDIIKQNRATGKTTRMLQAAINSAKMGFKTVIIAKDYEHEQQLIRAIRNIDGGGFPAFLEIETLEKCDITREMHITIRGKHNYKVFYDHYTLETEFKKILNEVFKWYL